MLENAYIGLGSNLDNPLLQVKTAIKELNACKDMSVDAVSNIYKSKPLGTANNQQQADYINAVVRIKTWLSPFDLLDILQVLEKKHHRVREYHWGPRTLDLDILLYSDQVLASERLTIPHPELTKRDFVLYLLNDINPDLDIPLHGKLADILPTVSKENLIFVEGHVELQDIII